MYKKIRCIRGASCYVLPVTRRRPLCNSDRSSASSSGSERTKISISVREIDFVARTDNEISRSLGLIRRGRFDILSHSVAMSVRSLIS